MALPNLKRLRAKKTLEQLSEESGISVSQLSRYERGGSDGRDPSLAHLKRLAAVFNTTVDEIISETTCPVAEPTASELASPKMLYRGQLQDSDSIQVEIGILRNRIREALVECGTQDQEAAAYADGVIGSLLAQRVGLVVLDPKVSGRTDLVSQVLRFGDPS